MPKQKCERETLHEIVLTETNEGETGGVTRPFWTEPPKKRAKKERVRSKMQPRSECTGLCFKKGREEEEEAINTDGKKTVEKVGRQKRTRMTVKNPVLLDQKETKPKKDPNNREERIAGYMFKKRERSY